MVRAPQSASYQMAGEKEQVSQCDGSRNRKDGVEMWQTHVRSLDELDEREVLLLRVSHNGWKKSVSYHVSMSNSHLVVCVRENVQR